MDIRYEKLASPFELYSIPVTEFPVPAGEERLLREFMDRLLAAAVKTLGLTPEVSVQFTELNRGDASDRLSAHGRAWMPTPGLGVWLDRDPPTLWTKEYFMSLNMGEMPRRVMHQLFRVTTGAPQSMEAVSVMLGCGTILGLFVRGPGEKLLERARTLLLSRITDKAYMAFPFYLPLFEIKTLRNRPARELEEWFCGASVYVRESLDDSAILIASQEPLGPVLEGMGGKLVDDGSGARWVIAQ